MKIKGNVVQGIYKYSSDDGIEFTKNDLVVSGSSIYICVAESVSGVDPANDTENQYFRPYPGSQIMTASEFFQYLETGVGGDKYVSAQSIYGILQKYQFGLDMTGMISAYIDENGDTTLDLASVTDNPIDNLMLTENLNRGMVKISHELPQIIDGTLNGVPFSTLFGYLDKKDSVDGEIVEVDYQLLLSQYTYRTSANNYVRIQELMSPFSGVSVYRYLTWKRDNFPTDGGAVSGWRSVFSYSKAIKNKLDALGIYYKSLADQIQAKKASLAGSFRFKEVYSGGSGGTTVTGLSSGVYTICLQGKAVGSTNIYTESVTVRVGNNSYTVYPTKISGTTINVGSSTISISADSTTTIVSIYGREKI